MKAAIGRETHHQFGDGEKRADMARARWTAHRLIGRYAALFQVPSVSLVVIAGLIGRLPNSTLSIALPLVVVGQAAAGMTGAARSVPLAGLCVTRLHDTGGFVLAVGIALAGAVFSTLPARRQVPAESPQDVLVTQVRTFRTEVLS